MGRHWRIETSFALLLIDGFGASAPGPADPSTIGYSGWVATAGVLVFVLVAMTIARLGRRYRDRHFSTSPPRSFHRRSIRLSRGASSPSPR